MMITVTCCFERKCLALIGPFLAIVDALYIGAAKTQPLTCRLSAVAEIKHALHAVGYLSNVGCCGGGWYVLREC